MAGGHRLCSHDDVASSWRRPVVNVDIEESRNSRFGSGVEAQRYVLLCFRTSFFKPWVAGRSLVGVTSLEALLGLSDDDMREVTSDQRQFKQLQSAVGILQLEHWLRDRGFSKLYQPLLASGVTDLKVLCEGDLDEAIALVVKVLGSGSKDAFLQACQTRSTDVNFHSWNCEST